QAVGTESERAYRRAMSGSETVRFEQFYPPLDRWLGADAHPTREGIAVYFRDVTERRKDTEQRLALVEGRYRALLEAAPDAMVVVKEDGSIVLLNLRAEKQFGYPRNELVGQQVTNIIPEGFPERLMALGTPTGADALPQQIGAGIELIARRKDGTEFPIELMLSPLQSPDGILVTAAVRDISVRKAAEAHLAHLETRNRGLLEAAPDAMVLMNQDGEIILVNKQAEKQFGYRREELVGKLLRGLIPDIVRLGPEIKRSILKALRDAGETVAPELAENDDLPPNVKQQIIEALYSARNVVTLDLGGAVEFVGWHKDGRALPIEIALSILQNPEGLMITVAIRDITVRKQAEARLLQTVAELNRSNEELSQFAYLASHDLQEPLRMVASYTQLLSRRYKGKLDSDADEFIAFAVDGATRMQQLIQDLLAYSRIGTKAQQRRDISSEEALRQALLQLGGAIGDSGAIVTHDPLPNISADAGQMVQVFQNLIANAIKYQKHGTPRVHVSCTNGDGATWTFSVKDNGLGIEPQYFERIFGMFQRLHRRDEFEGTGIGLAICKKIVERHGGRIFVESELGKGSTFRFTIATVS
ncbi:MAG: hypothetical protein RL701_1611, partial [Pseudomonadota bacterium]